MATKIRVNAGQTVSGQTLFVRPENIVVDEKTNGRWEEEPHSEQAILDRVESFRRVGQLEPVTVRRVEDNKIQLVFGFLRYKAAVRYNQMYPEAPMLLECKVCDMNAEEAFLRNIEENEERHAISLIDRAYNHRRLREQYGWEDEQIADRYNITPGYVRQLKMLLRLEKDIQLMVHRGQLALRPALDLAELPENEREMVIAKVKEEAEKTEPNYNGTGRPKLRTALVNAEIRRLRQDEDEGGEEQPSTNGTHATAEGLTPLDLPAGVPVPPPAKKKDKEKPGKRKTVPLVLKEVREFWEGLTGPAEKPSVKKLADLMCRFMKGTVKEKTVRKQIDDLFPEEKIPDELNT